MSKVPTKQLTKAFERYRTRITNTLIDDVVLVNETYGRSNEHLLAYEKIYDIKGNIVGHIVSYYHYCTLCFQLKHYYTLNHVVLEITDDCYSNTDRDNINGLLSLMNIKDIKAYKEDYNIFFKVYGKKTNRKFVDMIKGV